MRIIKNNDAKMNKIKVKTIADLQDFSYDPQGSYTGVAADKYETPVQDTDDL